MLDPFAQVFQHCWGHAKHYTWFTKSYGFTRRTAGPNIVGSYCVPVSHESGVRGVVGEAETAEF